MFNRDQLQEIALVLENEDGFYRQYGGDRISSRNDTYGKRRTIIGEWLVTVRTPWASPRTSGLPSWAGGHIVEDRDQLRRYFDDRYCIPQTETNKYAGIPSLLIEDPPEPTEEPPMTWKEELIAARAAGETLQILGSDGGWYDEGSKGFANPFAFNSSGGKDHYRIKPKKPKAAPLTWQGALKAARERGAVLQRFRLGNWCDEGTNGFVSEFTFSSEQSNYRIKPGTDPPEPTTDISILPADTATQFYAACPCSPTPVKEDIVTKPITITTTTFVNGIDISKMADGEVFDLIASEEAVIEGLKKIKAQPKKLVAEIAKREAGIAALVAYLDSKEG